MNSKKLIKKLWKKFPLKLAKKYHDYVGLIVSKIKEETNKIIVCLDVNNDVIDLAINEGADLIISHHPFIYGKKKFVLMDEYKLNMYKLFQKEIALFFYVKGENVWMKKIKLVIMQ